MTEIISAEAQLTHNSWYDALFGQPIEAVIPETPPKTRGRPRKHVPESPQGMNSHKLSDDEPELRNLLPSTIHKIVMDFKEYLDEGVVHKKAIENISELYRISYTQAFSICDKVPCTQV